MMTQENKNQQSPPLVVEALLMDSNKYFPSTVKPQRFGAGPAI